MIQEKYLKESLENILKGMETQQKIMKDLVETVSRQNDINTAQEKINDEIFRALNMVTLHLKKMGTIARRN